MTLHIGDKAPEFNLQDQYGTHHSLDDYKGKLTLFYFYPKDETPGCTVQACSVRDNFEALQDDGITVVGVSKDDVTSHKKFSDKHSLPFSILADPSTKMIDDYGAWGERNMYGRKFMGTIRSAVLVGKDLTVLQVWPKIQPLKTVSAVQEWVAQNPI